MRTLRAKLFVYIGAIFLAIGIFNNIISEIWIRRELTQGGLGINKYIAQIEDRVRQFSSFLLTFRIVESATDLDKVAKMTLLDFPPSDSLWEEAKNIISYDSEVAFVQIQDNKGHTATITPKDALLYSFSWALGKDGILWVTVPGKKNRFAAIPTPSENKLLYLLFEEDQLKALSLSDHSLIADKLRFAKQGIEESASLVLREVNKITISYTKQDPPAKLFNALLAEKDLWIQKTNLIRALLPWQENKTSISPTGVLDLDQERNQGVCVFANEAFSTSPIVKTISKEPDQRIPSLLLRNNQNILDLDMVKTISLPTSDGRWIALGFSLSSLLQEISSNLEKTLVATGSGISIEIFPDGTVSDLKNSLFPLSSLKENAKKLCWQNQSYEVSKIDLDVLDVAILTPEEQSLSISKFLNTLSGTIIFKISISLIFAAIISFAIALIILHNIAKKITGPIAALSKASEELSKGQYEGLILPKIGKRHDEICTLTHSFTGMVGALKDRDKIRGVLNKVVSKEISEQILKNNIELGGEEKIVTLLFSDIRNFTHLAEGLPPHILIEMLNAYMTRMCRIIDETQGVVDKFVGDEIMTLYGAPICFDFHAVKAIESALWMIKDLSIWNEERKKNNQFVFEIGIGIHTGLVYAGNMGSENRLNYTVIGANVNQAARICSVAKPMQVLISEETLNSPGVADKFRVKKLEPVLLKGIDLPVQVYEVLV